jgi:hypothetical protein
MDPREKKSDPQSDRNLEQDLELLRAAWPEPDASEPPGLVDQGIMNMARRELASQGSGRRPVRWLSAFATAAIVVLALTVVIQQDQQPVPLAPAEQDGFMIDTLKKQEAKRDAGSRADAEPEQSLEARREKDQRVAEEYRIMPARPEPPAANDSPADTAGRFAAPAAVAPAVAEKSAAASTVLEDEAEGAAMNANDIPDAGEWVERLLLLHQSQLYEKLEVELAAFREAYPDYPLPPELQN